MDENVMTLEKLVVYAQKAKEEKVKKRLDATMEKQNNIFSIVISIVDKLKATSMDSIHLAQETTYKFVVDYTKDFIIPDNSISLQDILDTLESIPALEVSDLSTSELDVKFSNTVANN